MSEEEQKYFKGLIGFTFDTDDIKYIEKIVDKKDKEIERLHYIIKEVRECVEHYAIENDDYTELYSAEEQDILKILEKENI